ncbi:sulfotransferase family 2 domain-containing protein [Owenweeksia hongkongensis]|uniref:sulfotransferase family 2 domain-containing protein n=1 Tax=Owenweeksia hongkongensis TaxID=253245 RepID=UPI003A8DA26D
MKFKIQPDVIAIHVPKTAGSTFHAVLKEAYGFRLKHIQAFEDMHIWNNGLPYKCNKPLVQAVYGHITAHPNWLEYYPNAKLITWVREPVERVISAYYHWRKAGENQSERQKAFLSKQPSLWEFVENKEYKATVNAYETYLGRIDINNYGFVGRTEHFEEDLKKLESYLGKRFSPKSGNKNVNSKKPEIPFAEKEEIKLLLKSEYDLYHELLKVGGHK